MNLETIRAGLDEALTGLGIRPVQEVDKAPNVSGTAAAAMVEVGPVTSATFGDTAQDFTFRVVVLAGSISERTARQKLDTIVGRGAGVTTSLASALEGNLAGSVAFCTVSQSSEYRGYPVGTPPKVVEYLGCEFTVVVGT